MCSGVRVGKHFVCFKTASLVFRLDLLPPRYLSADNDNEVRQIPAYTNFAKRFIYLFIYVFIFF